MIERRKVTDALLAMLRTATGMPVGDGEIPEGATAPPYYILYAVDSTTGGAPFSDLSEDSTLVYQVTCVSGPNPQVANSRGSRGQAEWLADKARLALLARDPVTRQWANPITVPGGRVTGRRPDIEPGGTNDPADAIISYVLRFGLDLTST